ncbi:hypothetical protein [Microbacterium testaceum]|uniref:hypothetical protein n=1 Tax=Microbacterium testaceum TaxID=2033 RepID=UPI0019D3D2D2|nr:hypothetical protein [Microbacterium testaceum]
MADMVTRVSSDRNGDVVDPHSYRSGTRSALFEMAKGTCYYPGCDTKTTIFIKPGQPSVNVHIAHIEGAERGSARFREDMTNEERRSFPNLILLCVPHHDLIDHKEPHEYSVDTLAKWKRDRESASGSDLVELNTITDDSLAAAMEAAVKSNRPQRAAILDIRSGVLINGGRSVLMAPLGSYPSTTAEIEKNVCVVVRSTGELALTVDAISVYLRPNGDPDLETKLMGRDDYVGTNPPLPNVIPAGASSTWMFAISTFGMIHTAMKQKGHEVTHFRFEVDLGDGEVLRTEPCDMDLIRPLA